MKLTNGIAERKEAEGEKVKLSIWYRKFPA